MTEKPSPTHKLWLPILIATALIFALFASVPGVRNWLKANLLSDSRTILSKVEGDLTGDGDFVSVIKVKTRSDLIVEVYSNQPEKSDFQLRARIVLPERRDGYFQLQGQPTNLALVDTDGDGKLGLVVPTFDDNLIPRLHVYRYDPAAQVFVLSGPQVSL